MDKHRNALQINAALDIIIKARYLQNITYQTESIEFSIAQFLQQILKS